MTWVPLAGGGADLERQVAVRGARSVRLTTKERDLIAYFAARPGRTITRAELLVAVWGSSERASEEPIYSAIKRLRAKIDDADHQHLISVHGDGYRWVPPVEASPPASLAVAIAPPADRFFGRDAERAAAQAALSGDRALVTLVGPGGAGKTRLAHELAAARSAVFCDLSAASDEAGAIAAVAAALSLPLAGSEPAAWARGIGRALAASPIQLLVLDNVEGIVAPIAALLGGWSEARPPVLLTSREALGVRGERVVPVGPLPASDARALFDDRVLAAGGDLGEEAARGAIIERLDRLPLALELAAAVTPSLGVTALAASLDDPLGTLVAGARDAPARHASLRAAVAWSWAFLSEAERSALGDLSVFVGAFDLEAARHVIDVDDGPGLLVHLCRRSQIHRDGDRLQLYTAVRELAREERPDRRPAEDRHAAFIAHRGAAAAALLEGPRHREGAQRLDGDLADLRAAFERTLDRDVRLAAGLALSIDAALRSRGGPPGERAETLRRARAALAGAEPELESALLLAEGDLPGGNLELIDRALGLTASPLRRAQAGLARGERLAARDPAAARGALDRALVDASAADAARLRGRIEAVLGEVAWLEGSVAEAGRHLRAGLAVHDREGDRRAFARTAALLAHLDRLERGGGAASELLLRAAEKAEELGDPLVSARVNLDRGQHLTRVGEQDAARDALESAARRYQQVGFVRERAFVHLHVAETLVGLGTFGPALEEARRALERLEPGDVAESTVHEAIACIHLLDGRAAEARSWIESGLAIARGRGAARSECTLLGKRGLLRLVGGDAAGAWDDFDAATARNAARGSTAITGASLADRAMAALAAGRRQEARADLERARELLRFPAPDRVDGRMLVVCAAAGEAFAAVARGEQPEVVGRKLREDTAHFFAQVPPREWDLVLRLLDWLVGQVGCAPAPRRAAVTLRRAPGGRRGRPRSG